jgi:hypothetical protein
MHLLMSVTGVTPQLTLQLLLVLIKMYIIMHSSHIVHKTTYIGAVMSVCLSVPLFHYFLISVIGNIKMVDVWIVHWE